MNTGAITQVFAPVIDPLLKESTGAPVFWDAGAFLRN